jgi:hypothetical protein
MLYYSKSRSGIKARMPKWWAIFMSHYPQISLKIFDRLYDRYKVFRNLVEKLPKKCPFERQIWYNDILILYIPALCTFNPFYTQLMTLKLKSLENYVTEL